MQLIPLFETPLAPMDKETTEFMMRCIMMEMQNDKIKQKNLHDELSTHFGYRVFMGRLDAMNIKCTLPVRVFILQMCINPAEIVMWAFTLYCIQKLEGVEEINFDVLTRSYFAWGFPTESGTQQVWTAQKMQNPGPGIVNTNGFDYFEHWEPALEEVRKRRNIHNEAKGGL